jgi:hypothetical protein
MKLDQFPGLNNVSDTYSLSLNGLTQADNVDLSKDGNISRRPGRTQIYAGVIDAAWGDGQDFLFIEAGELKQLNVDYSATVLATLTISTNMLYVLRTAMNKLYWSTGQELEHGVIELGINRAWTVSDETYWDGTFVEDALADELHQDPMPIGAQMVEYAGCIWMVYGDMVIYTNPYSETTDLRKNFIPVGERITNLGAVTDGLFITTATRTYFYAGRDPAEMSVVQQAPFGAIPNTMLQVDGRVLGEGQNTLGLIWTSSRGICAGFPNGTLVNVTQQQIKDLSGIEGTALLRELNGQRHYIAVLQS